MVKPGDFVTAYGAGYWQLLDLKPKIACDDYKGETVCWKKGEVIGQWAILKKAFTPKMKPKIDFSYDDASWLRPVSAEVLAQIREYFANDPAYKAKFENAPVKLRPSITNCWFNLPEEQEEAFRKLMSALPERYTMEDFWEQAGGFKQYVQNPPTNYILNFLTYPWEQDENANLVYFSCELTKL